MVRKRPSQTVRRLRRRDGGDLNVLCRKLARWAQDNLEELRDANPATPSGLDDRAADAWEPLLAIADLAGGDWPQRARSAALKLSGEHAKEDDEIGTVLLADIHDAFKGRDDDIYVTKDADQHIKSENLVAKLVAPRRSAMGRIWGASGSRLPPCDWRHCFAVTTSNPAPSGLDREMEILPKVTSNRSSPMHSTVIFRAPGREPSHRHTPMKSRISVQIAPSHRRQT